MEAACTQRGDPEIQHTTEIKQVFFDHDYPNEIVQKRKTYMGIKKVLKEKGIRFQTPLTKIRIHWNNGVRTYGSAREAARDMEERGYTVDMPGEDTEPATGGKTQGEPHQARQKLQDFQWRS